MSTSTIRVFKISKTKKLERLINIEMEIRFAILYDLISKTSVKVMKPKYVIKFLIFYSYVSLKFVAKSDSNVV